ncbi:MAG: methyltransferase domain-containing protein [Deltaproteobacteria bacterium]|nr:methyltransferase domain-containing protein [Deltaproteobacteria bacterium]
MNGLLEFVEEHLNVWWLRPESALCDSIASSAVSQHEMTRPSLDLGSGNGIFSFITAGGKFTPDYDWHRNVDPTGFSENQDIYNTCVEPPSESRILRAPDYKIDYALDHKPNLLRQAAGLGLYVDIVAADANHVLPFFDDSFQTIFSNILYWLDSPEVSFKELYRILRPSGRALICLQDPKFKEYCMSYQWKERESRMLQILNRGRSETNLWRISYTELKQLCRTVGFKLVSHEYYLSPLTLRVWDIGVRPLSAVLTKMVQKLSDADRAAIKEEWIETIRPFVLELAELDRASKEQGGFHFAVLEKP